MTVQGYIAVKAHEVGYSGGQWWDRSGQTAIIEYDERVKEAIDAGELEPVDPNSVQDVTAGPVGEGPPWYFLADQDVTTAGTPDFAGVTVNDNAVLTTADEGDGNGVDADTVDGLHGADVIEEGQRAIESVTVSGDGTSTVTLAHSLGVSPAHAVATPANADAMGPFYVSQRSTTEVVLEYETAPPSGTDNLSYDLLTQY